MKAEDWISVKDRLPQVGEVVLCASKQYQDWMLPAYILRYSGKEKICDDIWLNRWLDENGQDLGYITHWMPLVLPNRE